MSCHAYHVDMDDTQQTDAVPEEIEHDRRETVKITPLTNSELVYGVDEDDIRYRGDLRRDLEDDRRRSRGGW